MFERCSEIYRCRTSNNDRFLNWQFDAIDDFGRIKWHNAGTTKSTLNILNRKGTIMSFYKCREPFSLQDMMQFGTNEWFNRRSHECLQRFENANVQRLS